MRNFAVRLRHAVLGLLLLIPPAVSAQDTNIVFPIPLIEQRLETSSLEILDRRGSRKPEDRTQRVTIAFPDSMVMITKWAMVAPGGEDFNNSARHELAAYAIQKLFLEPDDYVVPPTVIRSFDLAYYRGIDSTATATFSRAPASTLVVLQYWLSNVSADSVFNLARFERDTAYARHLGNLNLLTHLIRHNDENTGNVLVSANPANPRLFAVDNGLAFDHQQSILGAAWRELRVPAVPAYTVAKLRKIRREDLDRVLAVVAEFRIDQEGRLVRMPNGPNLNRGQGIRIKDQRVQFGLTQLEIRGVEDRLNALLKRIDSGRLMTF